MRHGTATLAGLTISAAAVALSVVICSGSTEPRGHEFTMPAGPSASLLRSQIARPLPPELLSEIKNSLVACFDSDKPPSKEWADQLNGFYAFQSRYHIADRWARATTSGMPITLTWSFVGDGVSIPGGIGEPTSNCNLFATLDAQFANNGGRATWIQQFLNAFARWESLSGVTYARVTFNGNDWDDNAAWGQAAVSGRRGDVRIAMHLVDGGGGILAYNAYPENGDMVMDSGETWDQGTIGGTPFRFLRNTIMHEHGHGLGFDHTCSNNSGILMEPFLATSFDGPQQDDLRAIQRNYGDPFEPNNVIAEAADFGALDASDTIVIGTMPTVAGSIAVYPVPGFTSLVSIDANGEVDWWKFTPSVNTLVTFTLIPVGSTYEDNSQAANGACNTGVSTNALAQANLVLRVAPNQFSTYASQDAAAAGAGETVSSMLLTGGIPYYALVLESDAPAQSQLYRLTITSSAATSVSATDATSSNSISLSWTNIPGATGYQVFRGLTNNFVSAVSIATPVTNSHVDVVSPGSTFFYWVKATQVFGAFSTTQFVGGPEQGSTSLPANQPPIANAGVDQVVNDVDRDGSQSVTFNGTLSTDTDGSITNYRWAEGATVLANGPSATPSVSLPIGSHTITLTVTDNLGLTGNDTVVVRVAAPPTANAGTDQTVTDSDSSGAESVTLSGSLSSDSDGTITNYRWSEGATTLATGPSSSANVALAVGVHSIVLTVTDNDSQIHTDTVIVTVEPGCPVDFNDDGSVDFFDYDDFAACFDGIVCPPGTDADFNDDGSVDFFDYDDFVAAFEIGC